MEHGEAGAAARREAEGWNLLHDRTMPGGGNIDHIVVGPGSVIVLDAKAWNGKLEVRSGRLYNGGWHQNRAVQKLAAQRAAVETALGDTVAHGDPIDAALVITTQPDFGPVEIDGLLVLGLGRLLDGIRSSRTSYSPLQVEAMTAALMAALSIMVRRRRSRVVCSRSTASRSAACSTGRTASST